eukprot:g5995.t1
MTKVEKKQQTLYPLPLTQEPPSQIVTAPPVFNKPPPPPLPTKAEGAAEQCPTPRKRTHEQTITTSTSSSSTSNGGKSASKQNSAKRRRRGGKKNKPAANGGLRDAKDAYIRLEQCGEGTYGQVYRGKDRITGDIVAMKKIRMENEKEGFPITALREIKILKKVSKHPSIVELKEIVTSKANDRNRNRGSVYMVFEYMDHDLTGLLDTPGVVLTRAHIKCYMKQLLEGLQYIHKHSILHRDIKGANLLLNHKGELKIADWGLSRLWHGRGKRYTTRVATLWYRAPELLLGATDYGPEIDIWSVGCIFAELLYRKPVLPGRDEIDQLKLVWNLCGTPNDTNFPGHEKLPWFHMCKPPKSLRSMMHRRFASFSAVELDLVTKMLTLDPKKRITASQALDHDYFWTTPLPLKPHELPKFKVKSAHEFEAKQRRKASKKKKELQRQKGHILPAARAKREATNTAKGKGQRKKYYHQQKQRAKQAAFGGGAKFKPGKRSPKKRKQQPTPSNKPPASEAPPS